MNLQPGRTYRRLANRRGSTVQKILLLAVGNNVVRYRVVAASQSSAVGHDRTLALTEFNPRDWAEDTSYASDMTGAELQEAAERITGRPRLTGGRGKGCVVLLAEMLTNPVTGHKVHPVTVKNWMSGAYRVPRWAATRVKELQEAPQSWSTHHFDEG